MDRSVRAVVAFGLAALAIAGCGQAETPNAAGEDVDPSATAAPVFEFVQENAALRRITMEEFTDVSVEIDFSTIGGFDLEGGAPPADVSFCEAAATARIAWINSSAMALQFWHDWYVDASGVPASIESDVAVLLEHVAQRIAWNFRRADEPAVDERIVDAAHQVVTAAVVECESFPTVVGRSEDQLRAPWAEGSYNDLDPAEACAADLAEVTAAVDRFVVLRNVEPRHLEQVEAALLADEGVYFFGSDLHTINDETAGSTMIEPIGIGPCGE